MLIECGFVRATTADGKEFSFTPSFGRLATLGSPHEIVQLFVDLHGPHATETATYVLACLCDQDDPSSLIGWFDEARRWFPGSMPEDEQVIFARHLMRHGIVGNARPSNGGGDFASKFDAADYISAARVHLGLTSSDAAALSMTEFQVMFAMKFPDAKAREVPSREEYDAALAAIEGRRRG